MAPSISDTKRRNKTKELEAPGTIQDTVAISMDASTKLILQGRLADLNYLVRGEEGLAAPQHVQSLIIRVVNEIEKWLNDGGPMEFKAQMALLNMAYNQNNHYSCKDEKCMLLTGYLSMPRSATSHRNLSDEGMRRSLNFLCESAFLSKPDNEMTDKARQAELNLLRITCDSKIALHSIETAVQTLDDSGHPAQRSSELGNQAIDLLEAPEEATSLERATAMMNKAVAFTFVDNPDRSRQLNNLGNCYMSRFQQSGEDRDILLAIKRQSEAVASTPVDSADLPILLKNLADSHLRRFKRIGEARDIDSAIERLREAVTSTPLGSTDLLRRIKHLTDSHQLRFERFGEVKDIDSVIERQCEAIASTPLGSTDRRRLLSNLGDSHLLRFERFGVVEDIDSAIERHREAVASTPLGSADLPIILNNLGNSHVRRFKRFGEVKDIDSAIKRHREAVVSTPPDSMDLSSRLNNLGNSHIFRFERFGEVKNIDSAIEQHREAVASTPPDSMDLPSRLNNLGNSHLLRFERFGEVKDIDSAIERHREAVASTPLGSADLPGRLHSLGNSHLCRFQRFGEVKDIDSAIERHRKVVASTPLDSAYLPGRLNSLGVSHQCRFERFGSVKDIDSAIERHREAVTASALDSAGRPVYLDNLGSSHALRFRRFGEVKDIGSAIERHGEAVACTPLDSADLSGRLNNLGNSHRGRFERFGEIKDIDSAIQRYGEAVTSCPLDSAYLPILLGSLGNSHLLRFERFGEVKDLDSAVEQHREAVVLTPLDSANLPTRLESLGASHLFRFERFGEVKDIDSAIERHREAIASTPLDSADLPRRLSSLGGSHLRRFERFGEVKELDSAIEQQHEAVASTPRDSSELPARLCGLGNSHKLRFERFGQLKDIDSAIERHHEAIASTPVDSADLPALLNNLGGSYHARFKRTRKSTDLKKAISHYRLSSISQNGRPSLRIKGSLHCAYLTHRHQCDNLSAASAAYDQAIRLLPQVAWIGLRAVAQLNSLESYIQTLGCDAAACMIALAQTESHNEQRHLGRAIELLDQGRSILWSQTSNFKQDLDDLRQVDSQLACELDLIGKALGQTCFRASNDTLSEADAQCYRRSAEKWEELVDRVRGLPGFNDFLLPPPISKLQKAAANGPVVVINSSRFRCDALIIPAQGSVVLVPLSKITAKEINTLTNQQEKFALRQSRVGTPLDDNDEPAITLENVLNQTWSLVGEPVFQKLKEMGLLGSEWGTPATCRVWWCLTGSLSFLPIHASFPPNKPSMGMMDHVISSYTPTVSALLRAQQQRRKLSTFRMLAVGQSEASGMMSLPGVAKEIAYISKKLGADVHTLEECKANVDEVAASLPTCSWAHFACHGAQDPDMPMDSGLVLCDGDRLTISRLAQSSLASAEFAFLSCCQSAKGSKQFPNEAVHIAASLQFIGFRGVIGTMWSVGDNDALSIAMHVYGELFKNGTAKASPSDAALALHKAVRQLRDNDRVPLVRWVPFVHFGL